VSFPVPFTICFILLAHALTAQNLVLDPHKIANELDSKSYKVSDSFWVLQVTLDKIDSSKAFLFLDALAKVGDSKGYHFKARLNCLRARTLSFKNVYYQYYQDRKAVDLEPIKKEINMLLAAAMDQAYRSEDDYLVAFVSSIYASTVSMYDVGVAVMYAKNGTDLYEQLSHPLTPENYQFLAELLYKVREYEECVRYGRKAVLAWPKSREPYRTAIL
jgi:hypothetical protein